MHSSSSRRTGGDLAAAAIVSAVVAVAFGRAFLDLFPLVEFRDWLAWSLSAEDAWRMAREVVLRDRLFSRNVSLGFVLWLGGVAGTSVPLVNVAVLLPIVVAAALLFALARLLGLSRLDGVVVAWVWAFSLPVLEAAAWQATIHDRFALVFALACLLVALGRPHGDDRQAPAWRTALLATVFLILAYNSKESAFFLAPALAALALRPPRHRLRRRLASLAPALLYAVFHNLRYATFLGDPAEATWSHHVLGGDREANALAALRFVLGLDASAPSLLVTGAWLAILAAWGVGITRSRVASGPGDHLLWLGVAFVGAMVIPLAAVHAPPYYVYLPRALLALLVVTALRTALGRPVGEGGRARLATASVVGLLVAAGIAFLLVAQPTVARTLRYSENFERLRPDLAGCVEPAAWENVELVFPQPFWKVYRFFLGPERPFYRWLLPSAILEAVTWDAEVDHSTDIDLASWTPTDPAILYVVFDESFGLEAVHHGGAVSTCSASTAEPALY
ncbi:MAG: hypothetical protein AAGN46_04250 [Acidobacteriota bacterium]